MCFFCVRRGAPLLNVDPLVQLLRVDPALVSAQMNTQKTGDDRCTVGAQQLPRGVALDEPSELENLGDGGHGPILSECADIS